MRKRVTYVLAAICVIFSFCVTAITFFPITEEKIFAGQDSDVISLSGNRTGSFDEYENMEKASAKGEIYPSSTKNSFYYITQIGSGYDSKYAIWEYNITEKRSIKKAETIQIKNGIDFFYRDDKFYYVERMYAYYSEGANCTVYSVNMNSGKTTELFSSFIEKSGSFSVAVDNRERVYLATADSKILVFDKNGNKLAEGKDENRIDKIIAIDDNNGNIYYEGTCIWKYWGYDHNMSALKVAKLNGNKITYTPDNKYITYLYQQGWYTHYGCAELIGGKYLADLSTFSDNRLFLLKSENISPLNVKEGSTSISLIDSGVSVSAVNLDSDAVIMGLQTSNSKYDNNYDITSVGSRCTYLGKNGQNLLFVKSDEREISIWDIDSRKKIGTISTKYPVYKPMIINDKLVVIEKDNDKKYYLESLSTQMPTSISLTGPSSCKVGEVLEYNAIMNTDIKKEVTYSSSDPEVLSVDENGNASAWSAGTATVTAKSVDGKLKATKIVKVTAKNKLYDVNIVQPGGWVSDNKNDNDYRTWSGPVYSYLTEINSTKLMRVEGKSDGTVLVEYMDRKGKVTSTKTIKKELQEFKGFYAGAGAYYVVFGTNNTDESDNREVLRVVKYNTSWERIGACGIKAINTTVPVDAGSLRMAENSGILYIHTCHEMYKSNDGYNHQANMTFEIDEKTMKIKDSYSDVMNLSYGYVSHSFNQFIKVNNGNIYRVDHGDANPRGITVTVYPHNGKMTDVDYATVVDFDGDYNNYFNYTGASVGGFELSDKYLLIAYNKDIDINSRNIRNIFVTSFNDESAEIKDHQITNHKTNSEWTCNTPQLVKLNDGHFYLIWIERNIKTDDSRCGYARINQDGKKVGSHYYINWELSDCQPILLSDGTVSWYVTDGKKCTLYNVDPYVIYTNKVTISKTNVELKKGNTIKLTAKTEPEKANKKTVTWSSSNPSVATVDQNGNVKAINPGTATITVKTNDSGISATCKINVPNVWKRLWGQGRYDTMKAIVNEGFKGTGGTVIVATGSNFKDALAASGLAGLENAPVVLTDGNALSGQAKEVLNRIKPKKIYVAGGPAAVSDKVVSAIKSTTKIAPQRLYGQNSTETSAKLALAGKGKWKDATAIIATNKSFKDALSVAPIAYVKKYPILLADNGTSLSKPVLNALKSLGVKNVIIVGGKAAVTANVEKQITSAGIKIKTRLWGSNAVETSKKIAEWGINNGMSANNMGVATSQNFPDALAGAAMCGKNGSVLVLADDKAGLNATFPKAYKTKINQGYVFGGEFAVGKKTLTTLENSARQ